MKQNGSLANAVSEDKAEKGKARAIAAAKERVFICKKLGGLSLVFS